MARNLSFDLTSLTLLDIDQEGGDGKSFIGRASEKVARPAGRHFKDEVQPEIEEDVVIDLREAQTAPPDEELLSDLSDVLARLVAPATVTVADVVGPPKARLSGLTDFSDLDPLRFGASIVDLAGQIRWAELGSLVGPVEEAAPIAPQAKPEHAFVLRARPSLRVADVHVPVLPPRRPRPQPRPARQAQRTPLTHILEEPAGSIRLRLGEWFEAPALEALRERTLGSPNFVRALKASARVVAALALTVATVDTNVLGLDRPEDGAGKYAFDAGRKATAAPAFVFSPKPASLSAPAAPSTTRAPATTTTTKAPEKAIGSPVSGARVSSVFGQRVNPVTGRLRLHAGTDYAVSSGTPLYSAAAGTVTKAGWTSGYGKYTCITHANGLSSCYAHQSKISVSVGQKVSRGQTIGLSGNTGNSTGAHLHFEVRVNGSPVDPRRYM